MADHAAEKDNILRNLTDAGCDDQTIDKYLQLADSGRVKEQLGLLARQKQALLEELHSSQRKIDCLDFMVFQMKKEATKKRT